MANGVHQFKLHFLRENREEFLHPYVFRGFFLKMLEDISPRTATKLHDAQQIKPYAIQYQFRDPEIILHINVFEQGIAKQFYTYLLGLEDTSINLGKTACTLYHVKQESNELSKFLLNSNSLDKFIIEFKTPTYLRSLTHDFHIKFPLPGLVLKNLAQSWNEFAGSQIQIDLDPFVSWAATCIEASSFSGQTKPMTIKKGLRVSGFQGWVKYRIHPSSHGNDEHGETAGFSRWLDCLLRLGEFTNVGGNRTMGMGIIKYKPFYKRNLPK